MSSTLFLDNVTAWALQVAVIGLVGGVLPVIFRTRHPHSQLVYYHVLLIVCLAAPILQPWQRPTLLEGPALAGMPTAVTFVEGTPAAAAPPINWGLVLVVILVGGALLKLAWLCVGLFRLRRYRQTATGLDALPEAVERARSLVGADAQFCVSNETTGPVTFGFLKPVVLLPEGFRSMPAGEQLGIACHELLHVRRRDWPVRVIEELYGSLLWFHPVVWFLLARTRLAGEQWVDAEVVRLTADRDRYVDALLAIADTRTESLIPAPLFLQRRHLKQRMRSLLMEASMSSKQLIPAYTAMATILFLAAVWVGGSFPMVGLADVAQPTGEQESSIGYVVQRTAFYPSDTEESVDEPVVVELVFNSEGEITDTRVLSGPEFLRKAAIETALRGEYTGVVGRNVQIVVNFSRRDELPKWPDESFWAGRLERIEVTGLDDASEAPPAQEIFHSLEGPVMTSELFAEIQSRARRVADAVELAVGFETRTDAGNTIVAISFFATPRTAPRESSDSEETSKPQYVRVDGRVMRDNLLQQGAPRYPELAREAQLSGIVIMEVLIAPDGKVDQVRPVTGHPLLTPAAVDAVAQWVYGPTYLGGQAVGVVTTVTVTFSFGG